MVKNMLDLCEIAEGYIAYLKDKGMKFGEDGFPVFSQQMFLDNLPEQVIPYDFRKTRVIKNSKKTLLCFYCPDARIYPRLERVLDDIAEYRKYIGTVATDVTVTYDMRFISTVLTVRPSKLLIYGKEDKNAIEKLSLMGVEYSIYPDYHKICKEAA